MHGGIGAGNGQAAAALLPYPILVRENRTGCKKVGVDGVSLTVAGPQVAVDGHTGLMDRVSRGGKEVFPMPVGAVGWLIYGKIENRFMDGVPIRVQTLP